MRRILYISIWIISSSLCAQEQEATFSGSHDSIPLVTLIEDIESQTDCRFFFRKEWVADIKVSASFQRTPISGVLEIMLRNTNLTHFIRSNKITLLNNAQIISTPLISSFFDEGETNPAIEIDKGLIFSREYLAGENEESDLAKAVYEIGTRKEYRQGESATIAGYIRDNETNKPVEGAFVYLADPFIGTSSDADGFYSLSIPNGKQTIHIQSVRMRNTHRNLVILSDGKLDIDLEEDVITLDSVFVEADRDQNVTNPMMGLTKITTEEAKVVPVLLGEKDILKIATTISGVQKVGEGSAGLNIRGGKADQNLFLLDGTPVYNTSHFFGFFSVFNSDAIKGMEIYKSSIPVIYGGRLSSVVEIKTKSPNKEKFSGKGGIGLITSGMVIEGPIFKKGPSVMLGGRGTYSDFVINRIKDSPLGNNKVSFRDLVGKIEDTINDRNEISVSGYYSFDNFRLSADTLLSFTNFSYTNKVLSINWKHAFGDKLQMSVSSGVSDYDYDIGYDQIVSQAFKIDFSAQEKHASLDFDYIASQSLGFKFGMQAKGHRVNPGMKYPDGGESIISPDKVENEKGVNYSPYFSANFEPNDKLSFYGGIRYSIFHALGPATEYRYAEGVSKEVFNRTDTVLFGANDVIKKYHNPELRLSSRYKFNSSTSLKASYNRTSQNIHLLLNAASIAPSDIWRLSSGHIKPQVADQYSIGMYKNYRGKNEIEVSAEIYYKNIKNLIDFKVGTHLQFNKSIETDLLQGDGRSYGMELSAKKSSGWLTGWINYTFSRSLVQIEGNSPGETINNGKYFPTGYDKPHYVNSIINYKFTRRYSMTLNVVYASGVPVTIPVGKWDFEGSENLLYSERNKFRVPPYFRMDLGFNMEGNHKIRKLTHSFWTFSVYNLIGRDNIYSIFFNVKDGRVRGYKLSVFPHPIPTITYNLSF